MYNLKKNEHYMEISTNLQTCQVTTICWFLWIEELLKSTPLYLFLSVSHYSCFPSKTIQFIICTKTGKEDRQKMDSYFHFLGFTIITVILTRNKVSYTHLCFCVQE